MSFKGYSNLLTLKNKRIVNIIISILFSFYCFFAITFNRTGYTIAINLVLILIFAMTFFRLILYKEFEFDIGLMYFIAFLLLSIVANAFYGFFSYSTIILGLIGYSAFSLLKSEKSDYFFMILYALITIGFVCGIFYIFIYYIKDIFTTFSIKGSFFGNLDAVALNCCISFFLSFTYFFTYINRKQKCMIFINLIGMIFSFVLVLCTKRAGSILILISFSLLFFLLRLKKYKTLISIFLLILMIAFFIYLFFIVNDAYLPGRLGEIVRQVKNLDLVIDLSTRVRILMIFRDITFMFRFPLLGFGEGSITDFNSFAPHNLFGDIGSNYGALLALCDIILLLIMFCKNVKFNRTSSYFELFFSFYGIFNIFYGMEFSSRIFNMFLGFSLFLLFQNFLGNINDLNDSSNNIFNTNCRWRVSQDKIYI